MFNYEYYGNNILPMRTNMALEEFFTQHSAKTDAATVRFWNVPKDAVVLGYAQATDAIKKVDNSFDLVRRITGGSHVQFDPNCLAYTFTVPRDGSFSHYEDMRKYFAEKVTNAFVNLGIEAVADNKASTINVDNKVIASHAIFWGVNSALLHGLIIVNSYNVDKIFERVVLGQRKIGSKVYTEYSALKSIPTVSTLLESRSQNIKREFKTEFVKKTLAEEILKQVTEGKNVNKPVDEKVLHVAEEILIKNRGKEPWIKSRKPPFTKEEVEEIPGSMPLDRPLMKRLGYCLFIEVKDKDFKKMSEPVE